MSRKKEDETKKSRIAAHLGYILLYILLAFMILAVILVFLYWNANSNIGISPSESSENQKNRYVFYGAILAAIATVSTSFFTARMAFKGIEENNEKNAKRLKKQLKHDARQKKKDRTLIMRREIYMEMMEQLIRTASNLNTFPFQETIDGEPNKLVVDLTAAISKVTAVGKERTVIAARAVGHLFSEAASAITNRSASAHNAYTHYMLLTKVKEHLRIEIKKLIQELSLHEVAEGPNEEKEKLEKSLSSITKFVEKINDQLEKAIQEYNQEQVKFREICEAELAKIRPKRIDFIFLMREELGLKTDRDSFGAAITNSIEASIRRVREIEEEINVERNQAN